MAGPISLSALTQTNQSIPKTKIVCTISPASASPEIIRGLIFDGMSVVRLNFSHGNHSEHGEMIRMIRDISDDVERSVAILQDLAGPKIRVGYIPEPGLRLEVRKKLVLTTQDVANAVLDGTEELHQ